MLHTLNMGIYKAFGLNIMSEIPLPELLEANTQGEDVDVVVELTDLTNVWNELAKPDYYFIVNEHSVLFQIPNTAIFHVENGEKIMVSPMNGSDIDEIRLYVLGTCIGALLLQRKILPLHGSAIVIDEKAYAIVGDSGAGKSTLASAFINKGYQLVSDDVIPVTLSSETNPIVTPAYPQQKLWKESLDAFGMEINEYQPIFIRETKFAIPVKAKFSSHSLPLAGVFELVKTASDEISIQQVLSLERLSTLFYHTYRNFLLASLGLMEWHFRMTSCIANTTKIYRLQRPVNRFTAYDLADLLLNTIHEE